MSANKPIRLNWSAALCCSVVVGLFVVAPAGAQVGNVGQAPVVTDPPVTDPPPTDPPVTDPPPTDPPVTDPPATDPPPTDPPSTDPETSSPTTVDPNASGPSGAVPTSNVPAVTVPATIKTAVPVEVAKELDAVVSESVEVNGIQPAWDATAARSLLTAKIRDAQLRFDKAESNLLMVSLALVAAEKDLADLRAKEKSLTTAAKRNVVKATRARQTMTDRVIKAYMRGSTVQVSIAASSNDFAEFARGSSMLNAVAERDRRAISDYRTSIKDLDADLIELSADVARKIDAVARFRSDLAALQSLRDDVKAELDAYSSGSSVFVSGFVFPVAAPVDFIDSWGFPRMTGTGYAHWHQGTDIMGDMGAPLVASENGVIERLGEASLGGRKLWVSGDSGTKYYYAHLSAFVPGMANGQRICAGQVVGYLGDSGNAQGTPPHVHFEIHPGGGGAVNPFPILASSYEAQRDLIDLGPYVSPDATCGAAPIAAGPATGDVSSQSTTADDQTTITFVPPTVTTTTTTWVRR